MKRGFTLIELLVVIGILAILTAAVVVVLNPAELLRQARDAQRLSDFDSLRSAISLTLATALTPAVGATLRCTVGVVAPDEEVCATNATTTVDDTGWVQIDLTGASGGSPLSALPLDPVQDGDHFYAYMGDAGNLTFELNANLESVKYAARMTADGGDNDWYEVGTDPGLDLIGPTP
jgi:prepilin-type N-terminal cleavage/methylation domain-containing protein